MKSIYRYKFTPYCLGEIKLPTDGGILGGEKNINGINREMSETPEIDIGLTSDILNIQQALDFVSSPYCGATNLFIGTTRITESDDPGKQVASLFYEAYEPMAVSKMREIASEVRGSQERHRIFIRHRTGSVTLGQASILIAVSSPHRTSGHQMVMAILDRIKRETPIWKKIHFQDQTQEWSSKSEAFWLDKN